MATEFQASDAEAIATEVSEVRVFDPGRLKYVVGFPVQNEAVCPDELEAQLIGDSGIVKVESDRARLWLLTIGAIRRLGAQVWDSPHALKHYYSLLARAPERALREKRVVLGGRSDPIGQIPHRLTVCNQEELETRAKMMLEEKVLRLIGVETSLAGEPLAVEVDNLMVSLASLRGSFLMVFDCFPGSAISALTSCKGTSGADGVGTQFYFVVGPTELPPEVSQEQTLPNGLSLERLTEEPVRRSVLKPLITASYNRAFHASGEQTGSSIQSQCYGEDCLSGLLDDFNVEVIVLWGPQRSIAGVFLGLRGSSLAESKYLNIAHTVNPDFPVAIGGSRIEQIGRMEELLYTLTCAIDPSIQGFTPVILRDMVGFFLSSTRCRWFGGDVSSTFGLSGNPPLPRGNMALLALASSLRSGTMMTVAKQDYFAIRY